MKCIEIINLHGMGDTNSLTTVEYTVWTINLWWDFSKLTFCKVSHVVFDLWYTSDFGRYGFKMMLDQTLMGEATTPEEIQEYLTEFDSDWYIGLEKEEEWKSSVLNSVPNLFSLGHNKAQVIQW